MCSEGPPHAQAFDILRNVKPIDILVLQTSVLIASFNLECEQEFCIVTPMCISEVFLNCSDFYRVVSKCGRFQTYIHYRPIIILNHLKLFNCISPAQSYWYTVNYISRAHKIL